ncbi:hypothetical protein M426DRAFT_12353 [Hypoxylon sp. CI-4A]|nr:hypothetical protein M426DRAFT_12353 [Hypoxylon sp. CI-4A]
MASGSKPPAGPLVNPNYVFFTLAFLGLLAQWAFMIANGSLVAMLIATWKGVLPDGTHVKQTWTRIWPLDFTVGLLTVFFLGILEERGPYLFAVDLILTLVVWGTMLLVEDRRGQKAGPLRNSSLWQVMWGFFGAASVVPVVSHSYIKIRPGNSPSLPHEQAQAIPFTALWTLAISSALLLPAALGADTSRLQDGVAVWFLGPLTGGLFQDLVSSLIARSRGFYKGFSNPIVVAYSIVGLVSAATHISVMTLVFQSPELSWTQMYLPNPFAVQPGPNLIQEAGHLFIQFGYTFISLSVLLVGIYTLRSRNTSNAQSKKNGLGAVLTLATIEGIAGPGAALAWFLCKREREHTAATLSKKS